MTNFLNQFYLYNRKKTISKRNTYLFREFQMQRFTTGFIIKIKEKLIYKNRRMISCGKYFLRICPLTCKDSLFLVKSYNIKVDGPMISTIWKGPSHIHWNFVCLHFCLWALSHFKTRSPIWKSFLDTMFESKEAFTNAWWWAWVILACSRCSSSLRICSCLSCKEEIGVLSIN